MMQTTEAMERLEDIERDTAMLKKVLKSDTVKMGGRLTGLEVDEEDFQEAEQSLFNVD